MQDTETKPQAPTAQKIIVKIVGVTRGGGEHVEQFEREIDMTPDPVGNAVNRSQHAAIENQVIDALNAVQLKLAVDRGEGGF